MPGYKLVPFESRLSSLVAVEVEAMELVAQVELRLCGFPGDRVIEQDHHLARVRVQKLSARRIVRRRTADIDGPRVEHLGLAAVAHRRIAAAARCHRAQSPLEHLDLAVETRRTKIAQN